VATRGDDARLHEQSVSHSLLMLVGWGSLLGVGYTWRRAATSAGAWIMAALVVSHWVQM